jgi:hypothetical protein
MTSPQVNAPNPIPVTRANGLTVTWSGGQANEAVQIEVFSPTDNTSTIGTDAMCWAPAAAGTFTVPASVLLALPPGNLAGLAFRPFAPYAPLTGSGLSASKLLAWNVYFTALALK